MLTEKKKGWREAEEKQIKTKTSWFQERKSSHHEEHIVEYLWHLDRYYLRCDSLPWQSGPERRWQLWPELPSFHSAGLWWGESGGTGCAVAQGRGLDPPESHWSTHVNNYNTQFRCVQAGPTWTDSTPEPGCLFLQKQNGCCRLWTSGRWRPDSDGWARTAVYL